MRHSRPNQKKRTLKYIADFGSITQFEAQRDLGVQRLPSRITELKKKAIKSLLNGKQSRTDTAKSAALKDTALKGSVENA